jgi:hypothetical protein
MYVSADPIAAAGLTRKLLYMWAKYVYYANEMCVQDANLLLFVSLLISGSWLRADQGR